MPKPKPDQVIRHEVVLSRPLQETVDSLISTVNFRNVADPTVRLLNDVTGMATFLGILASLGITGIAFTYVAGNEDSVTDVINNWLLQRSIAIATKAGVPENEKGIYQPIYDATQNPTAMGPFEIYLAQIANLF
tara:strand:- start:1381 stop:1782 length:402 start_codon:yes stop_codon:yes gene_type:complete